MSRTEAIIQIAAGIAASYTEDTFDEVSIATRTGLLIDELDDRYGLKFEIH